MLLLSNRLMRFMLSGTKHPPAWDCTVLTHPPAPAGQRSPNLIKTPGMEEMNEWAAAHSWPFVAGWLLTWKVLIFFYVVLQKVNDFQDTSHQASRKIPGF